MSDPNGLVKILRNLGEGTRFWARNVQIPNIQTTETWTPAEVVDQNEDDDTVTVKVKGKKTKMAGNNLVELG